MSEYGNSSLALDGASALIETKSFQEPAGLEDTTTDLLCHWGAGIEKRISQHETMANMARMLEAVRLPLLLFALGMAGMSLTISPESRTASFFGLGLGQVRTALWRPPARHH